MPVATQAYKSREKRT